MAEPGLPNGTTIRTIEENVDVIRRLYAARTQPDLDFLARECQEIFAPDVVWTYPGNNPFAGVLNGPDEIARFFRGLKELTDGTFDTEAVDILASETRCAAVERPCGTKGGVFLAWDAVLVFQMREGRVARVQVYQANQYQVDEFWARAS